jgi:pimeloyl-ACP methyl ester carboxylesterase
MDSSSFSNNYTIVFAHGLEGSPQGKKSNALKLAFGTNVITPDMSSLPFEDRVRVFLEACNDLPGKLILVGSSMGAGVVSQVAHKIPEKVKGCVLLAVPNSREWMPSTLEDLPTIIIHGDKDELFDATLNDPLLAPLSKKCHVTVDDDHRLSKPGTLNIIKTSIVSLMITGS